MILPECQESDLANLRLAYNGLDSPTQCLDIEHFKQYPYPIFYQYNSRGFRDSEWPKSDLQQAVWCLGDSFTVGIGSPVDHTWPYQLSHRTGRTVINVSRDGASNDWICRRALTVLESIKPQHVCIMWSYLHRREKVLNHGTLIDRRMHHDYSSYQDDLLNLITNIQKILSARGSAQVVMTAIPRAFVDPLKAVFDLWNSLADDSWGRAPLTDQELKHLPEYVRHEIANLHRCWDRYQELRDYHNRFLATVPDGADLLQFPKIVHEIQQLDVARDGHHFDIVTARAVAELMAQGLNLVVADQAS